MTSRPELTDRLLARSPKALLSLAAALLAGCPDDGKLTSGCKSDEDCTDPVAFRCLVDTGECRCRTDAACDPGERCNSEGYCQARIGCYDSLDCPSGYFCDVAANTCLQQGRCTTDLHCKAGQLCDQKAGLCKAGCKTHGDCSLRETCVCTSRGEDGVETQGPCGCTGATEEERAKCPVGQCTPGTCVDDTFCGWGERCLDPAEGGLKVCESDYDPRLRPYCDNCVWSPGKDTCGDGPNFCLFSTYTGRNYCGVDCSDGQTCPNGYSCADVIVVYTRTLCQSNADCATPDRRSNFPCQKDEDCPNHGLCAIDPGMTVGRCYGKCTFHEGANQSFCSCVADEDCAQDSCDTGTRTCSISKRRCDVDGNGCRTIRCVDFGSQGGCHIGANCKPLTGLTCDDLRTAQP